MMKKDKLLAELYSLSDRISVCLSGCYYYLATHSEELTRNEEDDIKLMIANMEGQKTAVCLATALAQMLDGYKNE